MPREAVLHLPPSPEPVALEGRALVEACARALRVAPDAIGSARLRKLSFDARPRERRWRLAVDVWMRGERVPPAVATTPPVIERPRERAPRVAIVGSGPAGLFAALELLGAGLNVVLLERGQDVQARRHELARLNRGEPADEDCNYCFGEGGAGTYSDGKLYTRSGAREDNQAVLELLVAHGAPLEILASWRPHIGSNRLPEVVRALRETILRAGGQLRFGARAERIETELAAGGRARVRAVAGRELATQAPFREACDALVLAAGHSALDSLKMAQAAGAALAPKGFAMGVRIEHAQSWLDRQQYGGLREHCELPASFYELREQAEGRGVYSFCMCPGGWIVPATTSREHVVVNGMSLARRDSPFANSGLVVQLEPEDWCAGAAESWGWEALLRAAGESPELPRAAADDPLAGVRVQRALERVAALAGGGGNRAPAQRADSFAEGERADGGARVPEALPSSYRPGVRACSLAEVLPRGMLERLRAGVRAFDARLPGFAGEGGQLLGVESRTSSPVRVLRDEQTLASPGLDGLYPCGEGAGYAGGIVSAAVDGRRVAAAIARVLAAR